MEIKTYEDAKKVMERQKAEEDAQRFELLQLLEEKAPHNKVKGMCVYVMKQSIKKSQELVDKDYAKYEELAKQGVSYDERMKQVSKRRIELLEKGIDYYTRVLRAGFSVRPWHEVVFIGDKDYIQKFGFTHFLKANLKYIIVSSETWNKE